ncbi:glycine cleavage system H protein [Thermodesulfatator indicus DSM 15286]|uniref:Glycine cleavage system H protein n=1 Tax=Thermodesulfatator indicus (strain DSM 15286 / JCM 11887 / CIR29812) TaxID=667014 RepID=F8A8W8_THEID|nr:glycine cleavage system protein GcvH [Thermodesulfatator indicus]AEH44015.1 glycine cleavage system H protein [Thermodesulfatator indicus DSM 15286]
MEIPQDRLYSENHLWVKKKGRGSVLVGLTDFGQLKLGEIIDLELPDEGDELIKDEVFGSIESAQGVFDLVAPVSGDVVEINEDLLDSPDLINEDPYEEGWILKVKLSDPDELEDLLTADEYEEVTAGEEILIDEEPFDFEEEE